MCFCSLNTSFGNTIEPWGKDWYISNISDSDFRVPYEMHFPCIGINTEAGKSYALRIKMTADGNIYIINDTADYVTPKLIYSNCFYKK